MNPKICIVSTPNRDFNALFDFLEDLDPDGEKQESFHRDGVPYRMRHHDHRFEASRSEFRKWALKAAADFGYDVEFTGVGGLGRGMTLEGDDGYVLENAVKACSEPEAVPSGASDWDQLKSIVCETDDNAEGLNAARRMFGDCSQMAVFVIKPELERRHTEPEAPTSIGGKGLRLVHNHKYSCVQDEQWPPDLKLMLGIMMANRMKHLCPELIVDEWKKPDDEFVMDVLHRKERSLGYYPKDNNWGQRSWKGISDEALKEREKLFAKLGGRTWEVNAVEVIVESNTIWEDTYALQRACHFRYDVFLDIFRQIQPIPGEGESSHRPHLNHL